MTLQSFHEPRPVYLDCNASTPMDREVLDLVTELQNQEYGNPGNRTHEYGAQAQRIVGGAREQIARLVRARTEEVIFTSGATESNNLALLGLAGHGRDTARRHVVSTMIEHSSVLAPLAVLESRGFEIERVAPVPGGWIEPEAIARALRPDTLMVSVMHVNNETGVVQPITEICAALGASRAYMHVDAAQGFGKDIATLQSPRIDLISASAHKIHGPKGVGALIARRRGFSRPPIEPLFFGGGQERGWRPGTLPAPLIAGFGLAAERAERHALERGHACRAYRERVLGALAPLGPTLHGDPDRTLPHVLNLSFPGLDAEAVMVALKHMIAVSNGSSCTSQRYQPSHVLRAMALPEPCVTGALRISWCHLTRGPDWNKVAMILRSLL